MTSIKKHMENMKDDVKQGMQKVGHSIKHTAEDLKDEAKGVIQNLESKKDDMVEEYKEQEYHRNLKKHIDKEMKDEGYRGNSFK
ncbi:hypothetical protein [Intestinibacter bartlettii]|uniref:Uncharacterized protein n=1 Tax=Intestinibacter bartlettii TaxID=261299 RepID=A0ABS6DWM8_9FIRM|nr:hypothetical protein [Intestinibacter bartlettii]MBU5335671.1 hypothetical protein [Intestinibacter bartlettii]